MAVPAQLVAIAEGDTLVVTVDGVEDEMPLYRSGAPEVEGCGSEAATTVTQQALTFNHQDLTIYREPDATARNRYDRRLTYVRWEIDVQPYLHPAGEGVFVIIAAQCWMHSKSPQQTLTPGYRCSAARPCVTADAAASPRATIRSQQASRAW